MKLVSLAILRQLTPKFKFSDILKVLKIKKIWRTDEKKKKNTGWQTLPSSIQILSFLWLRNCQKMVSKVVLPLIFTTLFSFLLCILFQDQFNEWHSHVTGFCKGILMKRSFALIPQQNKMYLNFQTGFAINYLILYLLGFRFKVIWWGVKIFVANCSSSFWTLLFYKERNFSSKVSLVKGWTSLICGLH